MPPAPVPTRNGAEVVQALEVARRAHHVLGLGQLEDRAAGFLVGTADRLDDPRLRDAVGDAAWSGSSTTWYCFTMPPTLATSATLGSVLSS